MSGIDTAALCPGCFRARNGGRYCPHCGFDGTTGRPGNALPPGMVLDAKYVIGRVLGKPGGFGITYLALDRHLETTVAIKEYLPRDLAMRAGDAGTVVAHSAEEQALFAYGLGQFLEEARVIARLDHPNIVRVRQFFEANATGYLVMDYYAGVTLAEHLARQPARRLPESQALALLQPVLDGLRAVHARGMLHRDIKPGNVYLAQTQQGGVRPILIDFGAARQAVGERSRSMSVVLTEGYAPFEQYHRKGDQGPWTDVYAAAAVLYCMLTGDPPPAAPERVGEPHLTPPTHFGVTRTVSDAVLAGLATDPARRPKDVDAFRDLLLGRVRPAADTAADIAAPAGRTAEAARDVPPQTGSAPTPPAAGRRRTSPWLLVSLAVAVALLAGGGAYLWLGASGTGRPGQVRAPADTVAAQRDEAERLRALREEIAASAAQMRAQAQAAAREREAEEVRLQQLREEREAQQRAIVAARARQPGATDPVAAETYIALPNRDGFSAVRMEPSTRSDEVARVYPGQRLTCNAIVSGQSLRYGDRWARCSEPEGYIYAALLVRDPLGQPRRFVVRKTSDGFTAVRSSPSTSSGQRLGKLTPGTVVHCDRLLQGERVGSGDHWLYCPDVNGYIFASLLIPD